MLRQHIKNILSPPIVAISVLTVPAVHAQTDADEVLEDIIVTGSRISRDSNLSGSAPVQSVSGEDIQLSGEIDIADVINDIPSLLTTSTAEASVNSVFETTANNDGSGVGQQVLQLRGLGVERNSGAGQRSSTCGWCRRFTISGHWFYSAGTDRACRSINWRCFCHLWCRRRHRGCELCA